MYHVSLDAVVNEVKMGIGKMSVRFLEERREWRLSGLLCSDDLVLCGELEQFFRYVGEV